MLPALCLTGRKKSRCHNRCWGILTSPCAVAWGKGALGDRPKGNCSSTLLPWREALAKHLSRITSCPPQATDARCGQCLTTLKSNLDKYDKCQSKHIQPWVWLGLHEQGDFSGSLANVTHCLTCSENKRAKVLREFSVPIFTTAEAFF